VELIQAVYEAPGWGVGELWLDGDRPVWHELPHGGTQGSPMDPLPNEADATSRVVAPASQARLRRTVAGQASSYAQLLVDRLVAYFAGEDVSFDDVELELDGTPFQQALAEALRGVPRGEVVTYGELAALAGRPGAARAAGTFCARNALPIFVPCHRVVASTGLGPYGSSGTEYKRRLLALEGYAAL
jgi:methylated-DNA-[protein]-cysteine S-methyltransferase